MEKLVSPAELIDVLKSSRGREPGGYIHHDDCRKIWLAVFALACEENLLPKYHPYYCPDKWFTTYGAIILKAIRLKYDPIGLRDYINARGRNYENK